VIAVVPARPLTIVKVSPEIYVAKTISSLTVSGSSASVNWYVPAGVNGAPPSRAEAVPVATTIEVCELVILAERIVSTEIELYTRIIGFP
jgi:hypothetical protein